MDPEGAGNRGAVRFVPGGGTGQMIDRLKAYRARLIKAGRLIEARAVARCIDLVKMESKPPKA